MYSLLIKNAKIVDGTGNPWFYADLAMKGEKIVRIGGAKEEESEKTIDAKNINIVGIRVNGYVLPILLKMVDLKDYPPPQIQLLYVLSQN